MPYTIDPQKQCTRNIFQPIVSADRKRRYRNAPVGGARIQAPKNDF